MFTPKLLRAINKSAALHLGQIRKAGGGPYITHPFAVAWIVSEYNKNEDVLCAALLHDVLEDIPNYSYQDLSNDFGPEVADLVKNLTEDKTEPDWLKRKTNHLNNLKNASGEVLLISLADKLHNIWSMRESYQMYGEKMWQMFNSPSDKKLWYYEEVLKLAATKLNSSIIQELNKSLNSLKDLTGK
ncbi:MAG: HD domain-containing protein [Patescibacteria group bacterium]